MSKLNKIFICFFLSLAFQSSLMADSRQDSWYLTESGAPAVMESIHGAAFATLSLAEDGNPNIYFTAYSPEFCRLNGERTMNHNPVSVNGTLVRISRQCVDGWSNFYAYTVEGRNYVINQFIRSRSVSLEHSNNTFIFSAIGFAEKYADFERNSNAL